MHCSRLNIGLNNRKLLEKLNICFFFLQPDGCFVVESKGAPQTTPPLTNHPPIGSNPPGWHLNSKKMLQPTIHMATRRWCKHQCTESPAPEHEEMLNTINQVVAATAALLPQGQNVCLRIVQCSKYNFEQ